MERQAYQCADHRWSRWVWVILDGNIQEGGSTPPTGFSEHNTEHLCSACLAAAFSLIWITSTAFVFLGFCFFFALINLFWHLHNSTFCYYLTFIPFSSFYPDVLNVWFSCWHFLWYLRGFRRLALLPYSTKITGLIPSNSNELRCIYI